MKKTIELLPCLCGAIPDIERTMYFKDPRKVVCSNLKCPVQPRLKICHNRDLAVQTWNNWIINGVKRLNKIIKKTDK